MAPTIPGKLPVFTTGAGVSVMRRSALFAAMRYV
jgi:hypothetical protein